ncbi:bifunctional DNA primase/polymerase [Meridianimarinicoccus roseus]|uniref:bifunctional DNA primase/polymerase n=1 Tax=Meridianimarinicoccus roseus TaxID=2072018 RepID=UPI001EE66B05|nr:bifunctional DNA primase/polymerase [Meridianimarinicoccus roseus]
MPKDQAPPDNQTNARGASGRPVGAGHPIFADIAEQLHDNGYAPLPIRPGTKAPAPSRWSSVTIDPAQVARWCEAYPRLGVGMRTGELVGLDIDILDPDQAHHVQAAALARFGETLIRVGQWPKRLLLYRTAEPFAKMSVPGIEVLGAGQQLVAFGIHPRTCAPYAWVTGETPLEVPLDDLPVVDATAMAAFLGEMGAVQPPQLSGSKQRRSGDTLAQNRPTRDSEGRVIDGRDGWLSTIAFHAVHDAVDRNDPLQPDILAYAVWARFAATADLDRSRDNGRPYTLQDAARKVTDKLRLFDERRLPDREAQVSPPNHTPATDSVEAARLKLDAAIADACDRILNWHESEKTGPAPRIGLRATVGLGKTAVSRRHVLALQRGLREKCLPDRVIVFTPSHALAEEAAADWQVDGAKVAVLRGYERAHPVHQTPMCSDLPAVRAAVAAKLRIHETACQDKHGNTCPYFQGCLKQENRKEVAGAEVVVAPYDVLFTGLGIPPDTIALILVDEACWARAVGQTKGLHVETLDSEPLSGLGGGMFRAADAGRMADLQALRVLLRDALVANGPGPVHGHVLRAVGLDAEACRNAADLEQRRCQDPGLRPGLSPQDRKRATAVAHGNARSALNQELWSVLAVLLEAGVECDGRVRVGARDPGTGQSAIVINKLAALHPNLVGKPILHLDATMVPRIAGTVLPGIRVTQIDAAAPHMHITLVAGQFGKSALCNGPRASPVERARRERNLSACVDHVCWHAARVIPGRTLVVTYKAIEAAFGGIPGVEVAHFNGVAGLDGWRNVAQIIVIGRPLPCDTDLNDLAAALFGHDASADRYAKDAVGVWMRNGSHRGVQVLRHGDPLAEDIRAAICDAELIQAIGRGRGVNRTADNPLEVQVLADVALPLVHDRITTWDMEAPDLMQRMLLEGIATDSPGDAAVLHPGMFSSANQAKLALQRSLFKGQIPIRDTYKGLTLKSARYRRAGRGRGWQTAWWIDGNADEVRATLESKLGALAGWKPGDG